MPGRGIVAPDLFFSDRRSLVSPGPEVLLLPVDAKLVTGFGDGLSQPHAEQSTPQTIVDVGIKDDARREAQAGVVSTHAHVLVRPWKTCVGGQRF